MYKKYEKICGLCLFVLMCISLLPVMYLGRYNHPTGDDYYYGAETIQVLRETGSVTAVLQRAAEGVLQQYESWQGTYSAMFLMYLPPNIWSGHAYRFVTAGILLLFTAAVFFFLRPVLCGILQGTNTLWLTVSSALVLLAIQTVPFQGESFFWYNGSMYYTGYFAVTLIFFGLLIRYFLRPHIWELLLLIILAAFLGGGNYVSLLPSLLILVTLTVYLILRRSKKGVGAGILMAVLLTGLMISGMAPGNQLRQDGMWKRPAWNAILLSILQGIRYLDAWTGKWWLLVAILLTPLFWATYKKISYSFSRPIMVLGYLFGIFCSMSCPLYYTMGSSGPARALAVVYYGFIGFTFAGYYYLLGYFYRCWERGNYRSCVDERIKRLGQMVIITIFGLFVLMQIVSERVLECTSVRAVQLLFTGEAAAYEEEYQERLRILEDETIQDVIFTPYEHRPDMLYVGDFPGDPLDPTNVKIAEYFGKNSVMVDYNG